MLTLTSVPTIKYKNCEFLGTFYENIVSIVSLTNFMNLGEESVLFHMKTRVFLKYFVQSCVWKQLFASNSPQARSDLIF